MSAAFYHRVRCDHYCIQDERVMAKGTDFCEHCGAPLTNGERLVTVYRHRKGKHFIFEGVPARVCPRCGERYNSADVAGEMDRGMRVRRQPANTVCVPVIALRPAG